MPNEIKQEQECSASSANDGPEMVPKEEYNKLKRKLDEAEPELRKCKRRLEQVEPELEECKRRLEEVEVERQSDKEQLKQLDKLKTMFASGVQFRPKRATIRLNLPDFAESIQCRHELTILSEPMEIGGLHLDLSEFSALIGRGREKPHFSAFSEPIEVAGFQWKLWAFREAEADEWMGIWLYAYPPAHYQGPFEFDVDISFRLFNTFSAKDIHKEVRARINHKCFGVEGIAKFVEIKNLLNPKNGFLQADGAIQFEVDFTVKRATLDHFLAQPEKHESGSSKFIHIAPNGEWRFIWSSI